MDTREIVDRLTAQKYEELHRRGKTRYEPIPNYNEKIFSRSYNIDESSDDELEAESGCRPLSPTNFTPINYIRVQSKEVKKYYDLEEGLHGEGKRLAKTIKVLSTGKCIRRIYNIDELSSDDEQPKVKKMHFTVTRMNSDGEREKESNEIQPGVNLDRPLQNQDDDFPLDEKYMVIPPNFKWPK